MRFRRLQLVSGRLLVHHAGEATTRLAHIKQEGRREISNNNIVPGTEERGRHEPSLDSRYGAIGISALAAALKFKTATKNPAYAPVALPLDKWLADDAA